MRAATPDLPQAKRTCQDHLPVMKTLGTDLRGRRTRQNVSANPRKEELNNAHLKEVETTEGIRVAKRTRRERQDA